MKNGSLCFLFLLLVACGADKVQEQAGRDYDPEKDYFPQKAEIRHAENFSVSYHKNYKVVKARVGYGAAEQDGDSASWIRAFTDVMVLVQRGTPPPPLEGELAGAHVIEVPVRTIAGNSDDAPTRFIALEVTDRLVGLGHDSPYDLGLRARFESDELKPIGASWHTGPNLEMLLSIKPEVTLLTAASLTQAEGVQKTRQLGLKAAPEFSWSEKTYLGQLEWIKYDALFLNMEDRAEAFFEEIKFRCDSLSQLVADQTEKPGVLWGMHSKKGSWTVRANGAIAELMKMAGATNPFGDDEAAITLTEANGLSEGIPISDEIVLQKAREVDFIFSFQSTTNNWPPVNYMNQFPAFNQNQIYHHFKRYREYGAHDWYQTYSMRPDLLLSDMIKLFYPEVLPDHELFFMAPIEKVN